jgi:hypothetical protein
MGRFVFALLLAGIAAAQPPSPQGEQKLAGMSVVFSVDLPLDVPGAVLQPGTYVLRVKREPSQPGELAELQLWDAAQTGILAELHAVQSLSEGTPDNSIMTYYEGPAGRRVLKAWNLLRTGYTERIVYPAEQAAELAKITSETVLTMPITGAPAVTEPAATAPEATPVAQSPSASRDDTSAPTPNPPATFPKTAGNLPLVLWVGFTALAAFMVMRIYRMDPAAAQNARNNATARRAAAGAYRTYQTAKSAAAGQS